MSAAEIVVVGSYNRDLILSVPRLPIPGETCMGLGRRDAPGGKGSNQAVQAARCGARVAIIAAVGDDAAGDEARALWAAEGVDSSASPRLEGCHTGMAVILVDGAGENSIVVDTGANARLTSGHVELGAPMIAGARIVAAQLETPVSATRRAFELARASGVITALNAAPAPEHVDRELLSLTDILFVNQVEAEAITGRSDSAAAAAALLEEVRQAVVVTLGNEGAVVFDHEHPQLWRPPLQVEVIDTTGAGDAFVGAFLARLAGGGAIEEAMEWGLAGGSLACATLGAVTGYATGGRIRDALASSLATRPV